MASALPVVSTACASDGDERERAPARTVGLEDRTEETDGKVLLFEASTNATLVGAGGRFAVELRGIDVKRGDDATYEDADHVDPVVCVAEPCEWVVVPDTPTTFEFRAFLIDATTRKTTVRSPPIRAVWTPPPRPEDVQLLINGKKMPVIPVGSGDKYHPLAPGELHVEARWSNDVEGTGYDVQVATSSPEERSYATCSEGTSCLVDEEVPLLDDQEMSWEVRIVTTQGEKVAKAFQVCIVGRTVDT